jgi:hypothetical protein
MSLTMKSYESPSGFATMTIDELFFINGGSGSSSASTSNSTLKHPVGYVVARTAAEIVFPINDDAELKDAWAKSVSGNVNESTGSGTGSNSGSSGSSKSK